MSDSDARAADEVISTEIAMRRRGHAFGRRMYTDPGVFDREARAIILPHWHCAGHASSLADAGQFLNVQLCGESALVIRGQDGTVRAFVNVCRHRGSRLCREASGTFQGGVIVCPYHAWTYGWDGSLRAARGVPASFDRSAYALKEISARVIEGLVFVSFSESPPGLVHAEQALASSARPYGWDEAKVAHRETYSIRANWKLVVENYYECYHCAPAHPEFSRHHVEARSPAENELGRERVTHRLAALGVHIGVVDRWMGRSLPGQEPADTFRSALVPGAVSGSEDGGPVAKLMGSFPDYDGGITFFEVGPTSAFLAYPDHGLIYRFLPRAVDATDMEVIWLVDRRAVEGVDYDLGRLTWLWKVTSEADKRIIEDNQEGVRSRFFEPGPYAPQEPYAQRFAEWILEELR
jgi:Rieske 2Fe-2S family protein